MTKDAVQRSRWTFYEAIKISLNLIEHPTILIILKYNPALKLEFFG